MLKQLRQNIVHHLWDQYRKSSPDMQQIDAIFTQCSIPAPLLDHFAIIDLPGPHSGIPSLTQIFSALGYVERGKDYLADKQNDFLWMAEADCMNQPAIHALPQVVVADFRLDEMPVEIKDIIYSYACKAKPDWLIDIKMLTQRVSSGDAQALIPCTNTILNYFSGREWSAPTVREFNAVQEFNELLAWVLVFGRRPNHFTLSIHLLNHFDSLTDFHRFIEQEVQLELNQEGGTIKGGEKTGLAQGSTLGIPQIISLADGNIEIPTGFVEFAWRYSKNQGAILWKDYFTEFIANHADRVIESLYGE